MDALSSGGWMNALYRGGWMDALLCIGVVGWMR